MEVLIRPTAAAAAELAARVIAREVRRQPGLTLGLATGSTMEPVYALLARLHQKAGLDFSACRTFNLDEYIGVPPGDPHSYRHYMDRHFFDKVNILPANTHLPNGMAADLKAECAKYERLIARAGGIDLQLLGVGWTGHLGFNEPRTPFRSRTHVVTLSSLTREQNAPLFDSLKKVPRRAITVGIGAILDARRCLLLATGRDKADIVAKAIEGPVTRMIAATALQRHPDCLVILDEDAGARLAKASLYRSALDDAPKWIDFRTPPKPLPAAAKHARAVAAPRPNAPRTPTPARKAAAR